MNQISTSTEETVWYIQVWRCKLLPTYTCNYAFISLGIQHVLFVEHKRFYLVEVALLMAQHTVFWTTEMQTTTQTLCPQNSTIPLSVYVFLHNIHFSAHENDNTTGLLGIIQKFLMNIFTNNSRAKGKRIRNSNFISHYRFYHSETR